VHPSCIYPVRMPPAASPAAAPRAAVPAAERVYRHVKQAVLAATPMHREAKPEEISWGVLYLLSDEASFVTGTDLVIDGGYTAQ